MFLRKKKKMMSERSEKKGRQLLGENVINCSGRLSILIGF